MERQKCLKCPHSGFGCIKMASADFEDIDVCVLDIIKTKGWDEDSPEMFMFKHSPDTFLKYLSFKRKDKLPKVGDKVITLHAGFSGPKGVLRYVVAIKDKYIELSNIFFDGEEPEDCRISISYIERWYEGLFVLDENN